MFMLSGRSLRLCVDSALHTQQMLMKISSWYLIDSNLLANVSSLTRQQGWSVRILVMAWKKKKHVAVSCENIMGFLIFILKTLTHFLSWAEWKLHIAACIFLDLVKYFVWPAHWRKRCYRKKVGFDWIWDICPAQVGVSSPKIKGGTNPEMKCWLHWPSPRLDQSARRPGAASPSGPRLLLHHFTGVCLLLHCAVALYAKCEYLSL